MFLCYLTLFIYFDTQIQWIIIYIYITLSSAEKVSLFNDESVPIIEATKTFIYSMRHRYFVIMIESPINSVRRYIIYYARVSLYRHFTSFHARCNVASDFNFETKRENAGSSADSYVGRQSRNRIQDKLGKLITPWDEELKSPVRMSIVMSRGFSEDIPNLFRVFLNTNKIHIIPWNRNNFQTLILAIR